MRRVVITGIGIVSPLGCGNELIWQRLMKGECGISKIKEDSNLLKLKGISKPITVNAIVPRGIDINNGEYDEQTIFGRIINKEYSTFIQYALYASDLAIKNANIDINKIDISTYGVAIGSGGIGSLDDIIESNKLLETSYKKLSPYFIPKVLSNMPAGQVSIRHNLSGPIHSNSTACAAGLNSIGDAYNFIKYGFTNGMLAGGTEASISPLSIAGFSRMKALTTCENPLISSKPFDKKRDGFVIGEGSCVLVLEELETARNRNANIIAEICGYGLSADAFHPTSPSENGEGAQKSMNMAIKNAGINPSDIGYVNAHATSTPTGDQIESIAIDNVFSGNYENKKKLYVSSTKGATGHLLGAAGAIELAFTAYTIRDNMIPPTLNLNEIDKEPKNFLHVPLICLDYSKNCDDKKLNYAMKNSFGFGGINVTLILKRYENN